MPPRLRSEVKALQDATSTLADGGAEVDGGLLMTLARACRDAVRVHFAYTTREGETATRTVEPVQVVAAGRRWYLMAWDTDRGDWRTFRLDRMQDTGATTWRFAPREHPEPTTSTGWPFTSRASATTSTSSNRSSCGRPRVGWPRPWPPWAEPGLDQSRCDFPGRSSIRWRATNASRLVSGSTSIRLATTPSTRDSMAHTRWGRSIRFIVEQ